MLNIFLIILMLAGIIVFSLQPADKTAADTTKPVQPEVSPVTIQAQPIAKRKIATVVNRTVLQSAITKGMPSLAMPAVREAS